MFAVVDQGWSQNPPAPAPFHSCSLHRPSVSLGWLGLGWITSEAAAPRDQCCLWQGTGTVGVLRDAAYLADCTLTALHVCLYIWGWGNKLPRAQVFLSLWLLWGLGEIRRSP